MSKIQKPKYNKFFNKKSFKRSTVEPNYKGFLCSCNNREKDCIKEAYNLLNKYADLLYPQQDTKESCSEETMEETSIEDELEKELSELKATKRDKNRFQVVESGAKNILFIRTTIEDPVKLAHTIVQDLESSKNQQTRFLIRLVPIEITCKAYLNDIKTAMVPIAERYFKDAKKTFSVIFNHRNNNSFNRDEVIKLVADLIFETNGESKVDLKGAELSIIIEVIKGIVLIGVVPDFIKYKKYNLLSICGNDQELSNSVDSKVDTETETNEEK
ncbi:unnamed protein product [Phaedon cochleariae]|uniref:THUMP domain-containing protein n=1 Tax=Phaedon cochleariae TaxID=80249 RepID=A0A9N9SGG9_PHACE|nr:unnamed protein product [Phaedon cochleariae]